MLNNTSHRIVFTPISLSNDLEDILTLEPGDSDF